MPSVLSRGSISWMPQLFLSFSRWYLPYVIVLPYTKSHLLITIEQAFFMQYLGNMSQSWIFNSYAARLITALGYHEIRNPPGMSNLNEDIYSAVCWCFYLDRTLSTLLYRPLSLPEPCISPANLISADQNLPHIPLIRILFDLAQVQGELLNCGNADNTRQIIANHSRLQERMEVIYSRLQSVSLTKCLPSFKLTSCFRVESQPLTVSLQIGSQANFAITPFWLISFDRA